MVRAVEVVDAASDIEFGAPGGRLQSQVESSTEVKVLQTLTLKQLIFVRRRLRVVNTVVPLSIESQFFSSERPLSECGSSADRQKTESGDRERYRYRKAYLHGGEAQATLFVVVQKEATCEIAVILALGPVNLVFNRTGECGVGNGYRAPLILVVGYSTHIPAKNACQSRVQIYRGVGELREVDILRIRVCAQQHKCENRHSPE